MKTYIDFIITTCQLGAIGCACNFGRRRDRKAHLSCYCGCSPRRPRRPAADQPRTSAAATAYLKSFMWCFCWIFGDYSRVVRRFKLDLPVALFLLPLFVFPVVAFGFTALVTRDFYVGGRGRQTGLKACALGPSCGCFLRPRPLCDSNGAVGQATVLQPLLGFD